MSKPKKPRMTAKYRGALYIANREGILAGDTQPELYEILQKAGFFWNSQAKEWEEFDPADADPPTKLIRIRVWADIDVVEDYADDLVSLIDNKKHFQLVERSKVCPCRPPKQLEGRVYLSFMPKSKE